MYMRYDFIYFLLCFTRFLPKSLLYILLFFCCLQTFGLFSPSALYIFFRPTHLFVLVFFCFRRFWLVFSKNIIRNPAASSLSPLLYCLLIKKSRKQTGKEDGEEQRVIVLISDETLIRINQKSCSLLPLSPSVLSPS